MYEPFDSPRLPLKFDARGRVIGENDDSVRKDAVLGERHPHMPSLQYLTAGRTLAVVTSRFPFGPKEAFLESEIEELSKRHNVTIFAALPVDEPISTEAMALLTAPKQKIFSPSVFLAAVFEFARRPIAVARLFFRVTGAPQTDAVRLKNAAIFFKALSVAREARRRKIEHIHAYWLSAPATIAYVVSELNGIPWSASGHRYDLVDYNITSVGKTSAGFLAEARFIRTVSERGRRQVEMVFENEAKTGADGKKFPKVHCVHLGTRLPFFPAPVTDGSPLRLLCAANLDPIKGHDVLFRALKRVKANKIPVICTIAGDGPERFRLESLVHQLDIEDVAILAGAIPHAALMDDLTRGAYDAFILTSIDDGWDKCEGIPVSLMEAMAVGVPCIATGSGSVRELVTQTNGIVLTPGDYLSIAEAIERMAGDASLRVRLGQESRATIAREFWVSQTAQALGTLLFPSPSVCAGARKTSPNVVVLSDQRLRSLPTRSMGRERSGRLSAARVDLGKG